MLDHALAIGKLAPAERAVRLGLVRRVDQYMLKQKNVQSYSEFDTKAPSIACFIVILT
jgi:hypothetical protein